jgi:hypothetical protein
LPGGGQNRAPPPPVFPGVCLVRHELRLLARTTGAHFRPAPCLAVNRTPVRRSGLTLSARSTTLHLTRTTSRRRSAPPPAAPSTTAMMTEPATRSPRPAPGAARFGRAAAAAALRDPSPLPRDRPLPLTSRGLAATTVWIFLARRPCDCTDVEDFGTDYSGAARGGAHGVSGGEGKRSLVRVE